MAGVLRSTKDLWVLISGTSQLCSKELVGTELEENSARLLNGVLFYKKPTVSSKESFQKKKEKDSKTGFIEKLSKLLNVDENQCYNIFYSYLLYEYKGTQNTVQTMLKNERHIHSLLHEVWNYYYGERSYSLMCLKQVLSYWQDSAHPYQELYEGFLESVAESEAIVCKIIEQLEELASSVTPSRETHGIYMTDGLINRWVIYNLKEQLELLQILLLYYNVLEPNLEDIYKLLNIFQKHSFGQRLPYRQHLNDSHQQLVDSLGFLESIVMIECMEVEWIHKLKEEEISEGTHYLLKDIALLKRLDSLVSSLGHHVQHGPVLLGWMLVQSWTAGHGIGTLESSVRLGRAALSLNVFEYLSKGLQLPTISGGGVLPNLVHGVVYVLLYVLLSSYEVETLGNIQAVHTVAQHLLKYQNIATDFWEKEEDKGLGVLLRDAVDTFPLRFSPLLKLCDALCQAGPDSCEKAYLLFRRLPAFTELFDPNRQNGVSLQDQWQLAKDRLPYNLDNLVIPKGTLGSVLQKTDARGDAIIQWHKNVNGWQVCLCELNAQLQLLSYGVGHVTKEMVSRIEDISMLACHALRFYPQAVDELEELVDGLFTALERFSILPTPPTTLLASCVDAFSALSRIRPQTTWQRLGRGNFLPFLTSDLQSVEHLARGLDVNTGIIGQQLAAQERVSGCYDLCMAFLRLVDVLAENASDGDGNFLACIVFILHEIFPNYQKWRYSKIGDRERLGQNCLKIFHKLLKVSDIDDKQRKSSKLQEVCVYSLLNAAAGQALLRSVSTGEPVIRQAMEREASQFNGVGQELITVVRLSLSVLNCLLMLKPVSLGASSALQSTLFSLPSQLNQPHLMLLVAYYTFQRYDPGLATLAVQLLRRCAREFPKSLLACFGTEATAIRDLFLLRLRSTTEDVRLKVVILRFLTVCVVHQPGIIEMFTNIKDKEADDAATRAGVTKERDCLECAMEILKDKNKSVHYCPQELHLAAVEFVHSLWASRQMLAIEHLKKDSKFWSQFAQPLLDDKDPDSSIMAYIIHTLSLEVFHSNAFFEGKLDADVKEIFAQIAQKNLLSKWSKRVHSTVPRAIDLDLSKGLLDTSFLTEDSRNSVLLLTSWRYFLFIIAKEKPFAISAREKQLICKDVLATLVSQVSSPSNQRILIVLAELYMLLVREWRNDVATSWDDWIETMGSFFNVVTENMDSLHSRFHLSVVGTLLLGLNVAVVSKNPNKELLIKWIPSVCMFLIYSVHLAKKEIGGKSYVAQQLCKMTICLMKELIYHTCPASCWLPVLEVNSILARLVDLLVSCLQVLKSLDLAFCILTLFIQLSNIDEVANNLHAIGFIPKVTLLLISTYSDLPQVNKSAKWTDVYVLCIQLVSQLLHTLRHFVLQDVINFVGAHVDRMSSSLSLVRRLPHAPDLREAIATCGIVFELSTYQQTWRLDHPASLNALLSKMCEACNSVVAYLIKPSLLEHLIERKKEYPFSRMLSKDTDIGGSFHSLSCSEDWEKATPALSETHIKLLEIVALCLSTLQLYSPSLCDVLSDQNVDAGQWEMLLQTSFSTPSLEKEGPVSMGTVLTCINISLRAFTKMEKAVSPSRLPQSEAALPTEKHLMTLILEKALALLLAQAALYQCHPDISLRDKQFVRRELAAELNSLLVSMNRYLRRGVPLSPASSGSSLVSPIQAATTDKPFIRLVTQLVEKLFK